MSGGAVNASRDGFLRGGSLPRGVRRRKHVGSIRANAIVALALIGTGAADSQVWPVGNAAFVGAQDRDEHGTQLLAVDVNDDGREELVAYEPGVDDGGELWMYRSGVDRVFGGAELVYGGLAGSECGAAMVAGRFSSGSALQQIAIGLPGSGLSPVAAGSVRVLQRSATDDDWLVVSSVSAADAGIPEDPEAGDRMGAALATGDFNGDGAHDLAIGVPGEDLPAGDDVGSVVVVYGSADGLDRSTGELWHQNSSGVPDGNEAGDDFGAELAAGDFDGDGFDDLAVGAPGEDVGATVDAGAVTILYGSGPGLSAAGAQWLTQGDGVVPGVAETGDRFGQRLVAGRLVNDAGAGLDEESELVIGIPREGLGDDLSVGAVVVLVGRDGGFTAEGAVLLMQDDLAGAAVEAGDRFGASLAIGDFTSDGRGDLAIGTPSEIFQEIESGVAHVVPGGEPGLQLAAAQLVAPDAGVVLFPLDDSDRFGAALAAPDLDGDGHADLAVGAPGWEIGDGSNASQGNNLDRGAVQVLFGALFADGFDAGHPDHWVVAGR